MSTSPDAASAFAFCRMTFHAAVLSAMCASLCDTTTRAASFTVRQMPVTAKISTSASTVTHAGQSAASPISAKPRTTCTASATAPTLKIGQPRILLSKPSLRNAA